MCQVNVVGPVPISAYPVCRHGSCRTVKCALFGPQVWSGAKWSGRHLYAQQPDERRVPDGHPRDGRVHLRQQINEWVGYHKIIRTIYWTSKIIKLFIWWHCDSQWQQKNKQHSNTVTHINNIYQDTHTRAFEYDVEKNRYALKMPWQFINEYVKQMYCVVHYVVSTFNCLKLTNFYDVGQCLCLFPIECYLNYQRQQTLEHPDIADTGMHFASFCVP